MTTLELLISWYEENKRPLPWREKKDPYQVWISEIMSQQTTMKAVLPYFQKFMEAFPSVTTLAQCELGQVLKLWTGLGYPSRARNLHRSAQIIEERGFPQNFSQWLELPGVGPYTAAAVSSIAYGEKKGVVDGNVVRFCSRYLGIGYQYWLPKEKEKIQEQVDLWAQQCSDPGALNQGMMELGALLCTPTKPLCFQCPLKQSCQALKRNETDILPLKKPSKKMKLWLLTFYLWKQGNRYQVEQQSPTAPFLKGQWSLPLSLKSLREKPQEQDYHYIHTITTNKIYIYVEKQKKNFTKETLLKENNFKKDSLKGDPFKESLIRENSLSWKTEEELLSLSPFSLLKKAFTHKI
jgi:A/G-specific adenine glycosylase